VALTNVIRSPRVGLGLRVGLGEELVDTGDPAAPDLLEAVEQLRGGADGVDVAAHDLLATAAFLGEQVGPFEDGDVLLHGGETHVVPAGQGGHRGALVQHTHEDVAAGGVGQGGEDAIGALAVLSTYNHAVVR